MGLNAKRRHESPPSRAFGPWSYVLYPQEAGEPPRACPKLVALDDDLLPIAFELGVDPGCLQWVERRPAHALVAP